MTNQIPLSPGAPGSNNGRDSHHPDLNDVPDSSEQFPEDLSERMTREFWESCATKFKEAKLTEIIGLFISIALMVFTFAQAYVAWKNYHDTTPLVGYAKASSEAATEGAVAASTNARAAASFSKSASAIDAEIGQAVIKLGEQSAALEKSRQTADANARAALQSSVEDFRQDQRPYLILSVQGPYTFVPTQPITALFLVVNYGRSPALKANTMYRLFDGDDAMSNADVFFAALDQQNGRAQAGSTQDVIPPGGSDPVHPITVSIRSANLPSKQQLDLIVRESFSIAAVSRTTYEDVFGKRYYTDACYSRLADGTTMQCPKHNEIH